MLFLCAIAAPLVRPPGIACTLGLGCAVFYCKNGSILKKLLEAGVLCAASILFYLVIAKLVTSAIGTSRESMYVNRLVTNVTTFGDLKTIARLSLRQIYYILMHFDDLRKNSKS